MNRVWLDLSMSLDGYIAGPNVRVGNPLGDGGERLHSWMFDASTDADRRIADECFIRAGALVSGRTMFNVGEEPWGDPGPFHGLPVFVLTHEALNDRPLSDGTVYHFVAGAREIIDKAMSAVGSKDVCVMGGASVAKQLLELDLLDEMRIHHVPVLLGRGTRLFDDNLSLKSLKKSDIVDTPEATHIRYRLRS